MPSILTPVTFPTEDVRQQYLSVKAFLEEELLGQGTLCVAESQLLWSDGSNETNRQGVAIDYPMLTMHGIVTHDPKYPEEHLVVIVQKAKNEDDDDDEEDRSDSPVEYDAIETVNYRFVMASHDDLKHAYQTIADCQALHPDPSDDMVEDDEVGSDIDYGNEDDDEEQNNGNGHGDGDPYGYEAHFASTHRPAPGQGENSDDVQHPNGDESME